MDNFLIRNTSCRKAIWQYLSLHRVPRLSVTVWRTYLPQYSSTAEHTRAGGQQRRSRRRSRSVDKLHGRNNISRRERNHFIRKHPLSPVPCANPIIYSPWYYKMHVQQPTCTQAHVPCTHDTRTSTKVAGSETQTEITWLAWVTGHQFQDKQHMRYAKTPAPVQLH